MADLTAAQQVRLARLHNRLTLYEVALTHLDTGERVLLCYTRKTGRGIRDYIGRHAEAIVAFCGDDTCRLGHRRPCDETAIGRWSIGFTGRTQREAIIGGELPWFKEVRRG